MNEYRFFALRYVHDAVTQEFANVGIVVYSEPARVLKTKLTTRFRRLSAMFGGIDGESFRSAIRFVQSRLDEAAEEIGSSMFPGGDARAILARVLPEDASALQFHPIGGGLAEDLDEALQPLYSRYVALYTDRGQSQSRSDEDVWRPKRG